MTNTQALNQVFTRRWAVPVLAQLDSTNGCKFVTLSNNLNGSRASLKVSLELLDRLNLVRPNTGLGHPLRPEYILTDKGKLISKPAAALVSCLERADVVEQGLKKWSMPIVFAIKEGSDRFSAISSYLDLATDRAVSKSLSELHNAAIIQRKLIDGRPPHNSYLLARKAKLFCPILKDMSQAMSE